MHNEKEMLELIKMELNDQAVFSEDQITALQEFVNSIDKYITVKIESFANLNL